MRFDPGLVADLVDSPEHADVAISGTHAPGQVEFVRARRAVQPQAAHDAVVGENGRSHAFIVVGDHAVRPKKSIPGIPRIEVDDVPIDVQAVGVVQLEGYEDIVILTDQARETRVVRGPSGKAAGVAETTVVVVGGDQDVDLTGVGIRFGVDEVDGPVVHGHIGPEVLVPVGKEIIVGDRLAPVGRIQEQQGPLVLQPVHVDGVPVQGDEDLGEGPGTGNGDRRGGQRFAHLEPPDLAPGCGVGGVVGAGADQKTVVPDPDHMEVAAAVDGQVGVVLVAGEGGHFPGGPGASLVHGTGDMNVPVGSSQVGGGEDREQEAGNGIPFQGDIFVIHVGGIGQQAVGGPGWQAFLCPVARLQGGVHGGLVLSAHEAGVLEPGDGCFQGGRQNTGGLGLDSRLFGGLGQVDLKHGAGRRRHRRQGPRVGAGPGLVRTWGDDTGSRQALGGACDGLGSGRTRLDGRGDGPWGAAGSGQAKEACPDQKELRQAARVLHGALPNCCREN